MGSISCLSGLSGKQTCRVKSQPCFRLKSRRKAEDEAPHADADDQRRAAAAVTGQSGAAALALDPPGSAKGGWPAARGNRWQGAAPSTVIHKDIRPPV
jgi:hypothetical protein